MRPLRSALVLLALASSRLAAAGGLIPGPGETDFDPALAAKADRFVVQLHQLLTGPIGFGLNANVSDPEHRELLGRFLAGDQRDFRAFAGVHPYQLIDGYGDYTHAAIFGGVQIAGDAFRYAVLRDEGGAPEEVDEARAIFIRNLDALDWLVRVTGTPGVVARGIQRITPEPDEPPIPGKIPEDRAALRRFWRPASSIQVADVARGPIGRAPVPDLGGRRLSRHLGRLRVRARRSL